MIDAVLPCDEHRGRLGTTLSPHGRNWLASGECWVTRTIKRLGISLVQLSPERAPPKGFVPLGSFLRRIKWKWLARRRCLWRPQFGRSGCEKTDRVRLLGEKSQRCGEGMPVGRKGRQLSLPQAREAKLSGMRGAFSGGFWGLLSGCLSMTIPVVGHARPYLAIRPPWSSPASRTLSWSVA